MHAPRTLAARRCPIIDPHLHRPRALRRALSLGVGVGALAAGCATTTTAPAGFLSDYAALRPSQFDNVALYRDPAFDPRNYGQVVITPTRMHGASSRLRELSPELRAEVLAHIDQEITTRTKPLAGAAASALRVRAAVTDVDTPNRVVNVLSSVVIGPVTTGGASLEVEVSDAASGRILVAATCAERGSVLKQFVGSYQVLVHAKSAISECLHRFEQAYRQEKAADLPTMP